MISGPQIVNANAWRDCSSRCDATQGHGHPCAGALQWWSNAHAAPGNAQSAWQLRKSAPAVVAEVDRLLETHTETEIAELLNRKGLTSGTGKRFHRLIVRRICSDYRLKSRYTRLRARGLLTLPEMSKRLHVCPTTIKLWRRAGLLTAHRYDDKDQYLFEPPGPGTPVKHQRQDKTKRLKKRGCRAKYSHIRLTRSITMRTPFALDCVA